MNSNLRENLQVEERSSNYCGFHCHRCYSEHISPPTAAFHIFSIQTYFWLFLSPLFWKQEQSVCLLACFRSRLQLSSYTQGCSPTSTSPAVTKQPVGPQPQTATDRASPHLLGCLAKQNDAVSLAVRKWCSSLLYLFTHILATEKFR